MSHDGKQRGGLSTRTETDCSPPREVIGRVRDSLRERVGWRLDNERNPAFLSALEERFSISDADSWEAYAQMVGTELWEEELRALIELVSVNESSFFRGVRFFEHFRAEILPALLRQKRKEGDRVLRIWSAACSTGEEPYSIAICLRDLCLDYTQWQITLRATDVNLQALDHARARWYRPWSFRGSAHQDADFWRHFGSHREGFRIDESVAELVDFKRFNLVQDDFPLAPDNKPWDVILVRNVLMYLTREHAAAVVRAAASVLSPTGYFVVGECETIYGLCDRLQTRSVAGVWVTNHPNSENGLQPKKPCAPDTVPVRALNPPTRAARPMPPPAVDPPPVEGAASVSRRAASLFSVAQRSVTAERLDVARHALERLFELAPEHTEGRLLRRRVAVRTGDWKQVRAEADALMQKEPLQAMGHLLQGLACYGEHDFKGVLVAFRNALYLDPELAVAHFFLGKTYDQLGEPERAQRQFELALEVTGLHPSRDIGLGFDQGWLVQATRIRLGLDTGSTRPQGLNGRVGSTLGAITGPAARDPSGTTKL